MSKAKELLDLLEKSIVNIKLNYNLYTLMGNHEAYKLVDTLQDKFREYIDIIDGSFQLSLSASRWLVNELKHVKRAKVWVDNKVVLDNFTHEVTDIEDEDGSCAVDYVNVQEDKIDEVIRKVPGKQQWILKSKKSDKTLGRFKSKDAALKREKQIQYFKNKGK